MFKELAPYLRQRAVLLTVTHIEEDQIRVNIVPQKLKDGENTALTTPLSVTGAPEELDRDLPSALVEFVAAHLQLKNTLDRAKAEMDAAARTAPAEGRSKAKMTARNIPTKRETTAATETPKAVQPLKTEPALPAGLFDSPAPTTTSASEEDEEVDALTDTVEVDVADEDEDLGEAA